MAASSLGFPAVLRAAGNVIRIGHITPKSGFLGLSLIFSLGGVVNLAHGAFYAIGAYLAVTFASIFGYPGALLIAPGAVAVIGMAIEVTLQGGCISTIPY
ncbi:MAG: hypothetical protein ACE5DS_01955 [Kiloniellaceae bacterium]